MLQNEEFKQQTVRGVVKDLITKRPIPYANVYLPDGTAGTVTNEEGLFTIKVKSSSERVVVDLQEQPRADVQRNLPARERPEDLFC